VILMAEPERWQVSTDAAEVYASCFVPAIFGAWATRPRFLSRMRVSTSWSASSRSCSDDVMQALAAESENALAEFVVPSGEIVMPMDARIVTAGKGSPDHLA
jgi:hypothetical protein